ncbi:hypothetical protein [uncultured Campylobacter sp.]|uniref:hypothetical protein n=1 Tax=uncultured Campylobacter sp. TaxID=218934 RepID=UPI0026090693|nr:hypothetical protein [uncultured Campylobacter sp.]
MWHLKSNAKAKFKVSKRSNNRANRTRGKSLSAVTKTKTTAAKPNAVTKLNRRGKNQALAAKFKDYKDCDERYF